MKKNHIVEQEATVLVALIARHPLATEVAIVAEALAVATVAATVPVAAAGPAAGEEVVQQNIQNRI